MSFQGLALLHLTLVKKSLAMDDAEGLEKIVQEKGEAENREVGGPRWLLTEPSVRKSAINLNFD